SETPGASRGSSRSPARRSRPSLRSRCPRGRRRSGGGGRGRPSGGDDRPRAGRLHEPNGPSLATGVPRYRASMTGFLLVNPRSGGGKATGELVREAQARGIRVHVLAEGEDAPELARQAEADAIGIASGDGSLAPV